MTSLTKTHQDKGYLYANENNYISTKCPYSRTITNSIRPVCINWNKYGERIVNFSKQHSSNNELNIPTMNSSEQKKSAEISVINLEREGDNVSDISSNDDNVSDISSDDEEIEILTTQDHQVREVELFWSTISRFRYCDRDEGYVSKNHIRLNRDEKIFIKRMLDFRFIPQMKTILDETPIHDGIDASEYNNLITHIIFKGKLFYEGIIQNPIVSLYLCNQYYPIYSWICE